MRPAGLLLCATCLIASLPAAAADPAPGSSAGPHFGSYGFDTTGIDRSVKPGDDFFDYANGSWVANTPIPADRSSFGAFHVLQDLSRERTRAILDEASAKPGSKIGDYYASFLDEKAIDAKGVAPVRPWIAEIKAAPDKSALSGEMGKLLRSGVSGPFRLYVGQDDKLPDNYIVSFSQGGLGMPDRDYYLKDDAELAKTKQAYGAYLAQLLTLAGEGNAAPRAAAVLAFETKLAAAHWTVEQSRQADKTYNKWSRADFDAKAPGFDWAAFFTGAQATPAASESYLVAQPSAFAGSAALFAATPLPVLKDYLTLRMLNSYARYLSKPFVDASFAFNGTTLSGQPENQARWKRGVDLVSDQMGEAIGEVYVARYFPPETKAAADKLVRNLLAAMDARLQSLTWMAPETKAKARAKLAAFTPKIGYPDKWRDYSALTIARDDLVGNVSRSRAFEFQRDLNKLGHPIDRGEWGMTPMEINAYANPVMNEVVFPAAILQPPFFDPKADPAVNYGGIGAVIGHEISHHFDDQGRKYDAHGALADWWTPADIERYDALTQRLVKQYDAYEPLPGVHIRGGATLGENIADVVGLTVAHDAYALSLGGKPAPVIDGTTGDERFYLGWAQVWRSKYREAMLRQQLLSDVHSPAEQRVETVRNLDPWYDAFKVGPEAKLYLAPADRVRIW